MGELEICWFSWLMGLGGGAVITLFIQHERNETKRVRQERLEMEERIERERNER